MSIAATYTPGALSTSAPTEYSFGFTGVQLHENNSQPRIFVSHCDEFDLWQVNEPIMHSMKKLVMTGSTKTIKEDLSDAFANGLVADYIVEKRVLEDGPTYDEHLVLQREYPLVSFAARVGNETSFFFTGTPMLNFCSTSDDPNIQKFDDGCDIWIDDITAPLYLYTLDRVTEDRTNKTVEQVKQVNETDTPIGFVSFHRVTNDDVNTDANTTDAADVINVHVKTKPHFWSKPVLMVILSVLIIAALGLFLFTWAKRNNGYTAVP